MTKATTTKAPRIGGPEEAAAIYGVHPATLRRWMQRTGGQWPGLIQTPTQRAMRFNLDVVTESLSEQDWLTAYGIDTNGGFAGPAITSTKRKAKRRRS